MTTNDAVRWADWARAALAAFPGSNEGDDDLETNASDLIADLLHLVNQTGGDAEAAYERAWRHYSTEIAEQEAK